MSCGEDPDEMIPFIEGYWEIVEVKKDGKLVKSYSINLNVDYFEVNEDLSGFRKKVSPTFDGKYNVSQHQTSFNLKTESKRLVIYYSDNDIKYKETIVQATSTTLRIENEQGFVYIYKPFQLLNETYE